MSKYALLGAVGALGFTNTATAGDCGSFANKGFNDDTVHYRFDTTSGSIGCQDLNGGDSWSKVRFYRIIGFTDNDCTKAKYKYCDGQDNDGNTVSSCLKHGTDDAFYNGAILSSQSLHDFCPPKAALTGLEQEDTYTQLNNQRDSADTECAASEFVGASCTEKVDDGPAVGDACTQAEYQGVTAGQEDPVWAVGTVHYGLSGSGAGKDCKLENAAGSYVRFYKILGFEIAEKDGEQGCFAEISYCDDDMKNDRTATSCLTYEGDNSALVDFYTAIKDGTSPKNHCQPDQNFAAYAFAKYGGGSGAGVAGSEAEADAQCAIDGRATCLETNACDLSGCDKTQISSAYVKRVESEATCSGDTTGEDTNDVGASCQTVGCDASVLLNSFGACGVNPTCATALAGNSELCTSDGKADIDSPEGITCAQDPCSAAECCDDGAADVTWITDPNYGTCNDYIEREKVQNSVVQADNSLWVPITETQKNFGLDPDNQNPMLKLSTAEPSTDNTPNAAAVTATIAAAKETCAKIDACKAFTINSGQTTNYYTNHVFAVFFTGATCTAQENDDTFDWFTKE